MRRPATCGKLIYRAIISVSTETRMRKQGRSTPCSVAPEALVQFGRGELVDRIAQLKQPITFRRCRHAKPLTSGLGVASATPIAASSGPNHKAPGSAGGYLLISLIDRRLC
jgi:hypothetical protein